MTTMKERGGSKGKRATATRRTIPTAPEASKPVTSYQCTRCRRWTASGPGEICPQCVKPQNEFIKRPVIDWVGTDAPDPRDAYTTRINGHVVGVHSTEEAARNHAWALEGYLGMVSPSAGVNTGE